MLTAMMCGSGVVTCEMTWPSICGSRHLPDQLIVLRTIVNCLLLFLAKKAECACLAMLGCHLGFAAVNLSSKSLCLSLCMVLQIRLNDPSQYQSIVDAEWNIIYDKLDKCVQSGAKIVLSRLAIGDLATQYFADRDIFCAGRVSFSIWYFFLIFI